MAKRGFTEEADNVLDRLAKLIESAPDKRSKARLIRSTAAIKRDIEAVGKEVKRKADPLKQLAETGDLDRLRSELLERRW